MSVSCGCMGIWLVFLVLILLTRFSQQGSLVSGGGQWADHVPRSCSRLIGISRRWDVPGICLGDAQMEVPGVPAESGRSDPLLWRMLSYLTLSDTVSVKSRGATPGIQSKFQITAPTYRVTA